PTTYQDNPANGPIYPSFIPKTDSDGDDIAGVRLADVTVPLATYTGWALRRGGERRLRGERAVHSIRDDRSRPRGEERSASVGRRALSHLRRLSRQGAGRAERHGRRPATPVRGRRVRRDAPDAGRRDPRRAERARRAADTADAARVRAEEASRQARSR